MKAVLLKAFGDGSNLYLGEVAAPLMTDDKIRIRVHASGVNRADVQQRKGFYPPPPGESEILGLEVAGEVIEIGRGVQGWKNGDRAMALLAGGGYAEEVTVDAGLALPVPTSYSWAEAAAAVEAYLTAFHNIFRLGGLQRGEQVLIHAGASSVGLASLQLVQGYAARAFVTVGSPEKAKFCSTLGATAIQYKTENFAEVIQRETSGKGVQVILDPIAASYLDKNLDSLSIGGRQVLIGLMGGREAQLDLRKILMKRIRLIGSTLRALPIEDKRQIVREFDAQFGDSMRSGKLRPIVDRQFKITEVADAHAHMEANANTGKIVLTWDV